MTHWWDLYGDRWARELQAVTDAGWRFTIEEEHADAGVIGLRIRYPLPADRSWEVAPAEGTATRSAPSTGAETPQETTSPEQAGSEQTGSEREAVSDASLALSVELLVRFPDTYPWFPPEVSDPRGDLLVGRHRQPASGVLCLVHDRDWHVETTAAELIATQLPRLLQAATAADADQAAGLETPVPEPLGVQIPDRAGARILVDSSWHIPPEADHGILVLGLARYTDGRLGPGAVLSLHSQGWKSATLAAPLGDRYETHVLGRWLRRDHLDLTQSPDLLWEKITADLPELRLEEETGRAVQPVEDGVEVIGLLVPSEITYRTAGEEWFFLLRNAPEDDQAGDPVVEVFHSCAAGPDDVAARTPTTRPLRSRSAMVVGVGALGSMVATELARAGIGRLDLVDGDFCDPATSCRQVAPFQYAGLPKAQVLHHVLRESHPYTHLHGHVTRIGSVQLPTPGQPNTHPAMAWLVKHAALVVDAAADPALTRYLAALCLSLETTLLHVSATAGAWGGTVALFPPQHSGCWWCMLHHRADNALPVPPAAPVEDGTITPAGCATATFTGTGADLATIATHAARIAIDYLTGTPATAPPTAVVHVAALRDDTGAPQPVTWHSEAIHVHPGCPTRTAHPRPDQPGAADAAAASSETKDGTAPGGHRREVPSEPGRPAPGDAGAVEERR